MQEGNNLHHIRSVSKSLTRIHTIFKYVDKCNVMNTRRKNIQRCSLFLKVLLCVYEYGLKSKQTEQLNLKHMYIQKNRRQKLYLTLTHVNEPV